MKRETWFVTSLSLASILSVTSAFALDVYPAQGQPPEQQAQDKAICEQYAKQQTGFDPQTALSSPSQQQQPEAVRPRKRMREEEMAQQQQSAQLKQKMQAYNTAESVCLKGRGYSVG